MKKIYFATLLLVAFFSSCTNDDIDVVEDGRVNLVNVSVSLSKLFSTYNYNDTKHGITVSEDYRTFHSESGGYIHVRTMFYDANGVLVDSLVSYSANTNTVNSTIKLAPGNYTVVSMLSFAGDDTGERNTWFWSLKDRENLSTAVAMPTTPADRFSKWCIMSYEAKKLTVIEGNANTISLTPSPVGTVCYMFLQNFQYLNEATYGTVADNGIRELAVYSREIADGYRLNPRASEKYVYRDDSGDMWYYLSGPQRPQSFNKDWTYFKSNLYDYFYILSPIQTLCFGYTLEGESDFHGYGMNTYDIESGKVYLAYWDYFTVGNPYFGVADNNHWHSYSNSAREFIQESANARSMIIQNEDF